jgi:threonine dehydrogenase-like Zn-dependent dehydrogenase
MSESMRAAVASAGKLTVVDVPLPTPGPGQALVRSLACGLCGSDLHFLELQQAAGDRMPDFVLGHEFCVEVVDYGPGTAAPFPRGTLACSVPYATGAAGPELLGYSTTFNGGFAEFLLVDADRLIAVPNGLEANFAALSEPLAVGAHAVGLDPVTPDTPALVLGAGPVGLAVVVALRRQGRSPIVVSDPSAVRRDAAKRFGADLVLDPTSQSPWEALAELGLEATLPAPLSAAGARPVPLTVYECVGVPGMLQSTLEGIPIGARIVVVGVCQVADTVVPALGTTKEVELRFSYAYRPEEYEATMHDLASGAIDGSQFLSDVVGLSGIAEAVDRLRSSADQIKIMVDPTL